ncbi:unnamed protein product [Closterium sp. Naga37s-1]|nr:unnamed protein product [Closterium sp. Naga37s-1]
MFSVLRRSLSFSPLSSRPFPFSSIRPRPFPSRPVALVLSLPISLLSPVSLLIPSLSSFPFPSHRFRPFPSRTVAFFFSLPVSSYRLSGVLCSPPIALDFSAPLPLPSLSPLPSHCLPSPRISPSLTRRSLPDALSLVAPSPSLSVTLPSLPVALALSPPFPLLFLSSLPSRRSLSHRSLPVALDAHVLSHPPSPTASPSHSPRNALPSPTHFLLPSPASSPSHSPSNALPVPFLSPFLSPFSPTLLSSSLSPPLSRRARFLPPTPVELAFFSPSPNITILVPIDLSPTRSVKIFVVLSLSLLSPPFRNTLASPNPHPHFSPFFPSSFPLSPRHLLALPSGPFPSPWNSMFFPAYVFPRVRFFPHGICSV